MPSKPLTAFLSSFGIAAYVLSGCVKTPQSAITRQPISATATPTNVPADVPADSREQTSAFVDVAEQAGLKYRWVISGKRPLTILQTIGNGCAFLDYNNDGLLDILLVGPRTALFKNQGGGRFSDVSAATGLGTLKGHFLGCAVGDYDNDGWPDVYLSAYRGGALLRNQKGGRFRNITRESGIASQPWGTSCAWGDVNNDGRLDLYIGNYVKFGPKEPQLCGVGILTTSCGPRWYKPERGALYLNTGSKFRDVSASWNLNSATGKALGAAWADYNNTGRQSLAIANDEVAGDLMRNQGRNFKNIGAASGTAYDQNGEVHGGMGIDWGDYDNDGDLDLVVATFKDEVKCIYRNDSGDFFSETSDAIGLGDSRPFVTFGTKWLDFDNDGWLDLMLANGHVQDNAAAIDNTTTYRQSIQLFHNTKGRFSQVANRLSEAARRPIVGRGLAIGDYDNDGRVDVLVVDSEGAPLLLHNRMPGAGNWLSLDLQGTKANRDGIGAVVTVTANGFKQTRHCATDGSYMSSSDKRVHFGLGEADKIESIVVRWPGGGQTTLRNPAINRVLKVRQSAH